jgi:hypothetical protein
MARPEVEKATVAVWSGWLGLINDGARLVSAAPLERMQRIRVIETTTPPPTFVGSREWAALHNASITELAPLLDAALAFRTAYEAVLEAHDPTLHH